MNTPSAAQPPRHLPESTWRELRAAYASGMGLRELARNMEIPAGTILARSKREGWTRQIQAAKALACPPERQTTPSPVAVVDAVAATMAERGQRHLQRMAGVVEKTLPHVESMAPGEVLDRVDDIDRLDKIGRRTFGLDDQGNSVVRVNIYAGTHPPQIDGAVIDI